MCILCIRIEAKIIQIDDTPVRLDKEQSKYIIVYLLQPTFTTICKNLNQILFPSIWINFKKLVQCHYAVNKLFVFVFLWPGLHNHYNQWPNETKATASQATGLRTCQSKGNTRINWKGGYVHMFIIFKWLGYNLMTKERFLPSLVYK